jgi:uncharacterized membrane protein (DUF485 family)
MTWYLWILLTLHFIGTIVFIVAWIDITIHKYKFITWQSLIALLMFLVSWELSLLALSIRNKIEDMEVME